MKVIRGNVLRNLSGQMLLGITINTFFLFILIGEEYEDIYLYMMIASIVLVLAAAFFHQMTNFFKIDTENKYIIKLGRKFDRHKIKKIFIYDERNRHDVVLISGFSHILLVSGINDIEKREINELFKEFMDKDYDEKFFIKKHKSRIPGLAVLIILILIIYGIGIYVIKDKFSGVRIESKTINIELYKENRVLFNIQGLNVWMLEGWLYDEERGVISNIEGGEYTVKTMRDPMNQDEIEVSNMKKMLKPIGISSSYDIFRKTLSNNYGLLYLMLRGLIYSDVSNLYVADIKSFMIFVREYDFEDGNRFVISIFNKKTGEETVVKTSSFESVEQIKEILLNGIEY